MSQEELLKESRNSIEVSVKSDEHSLKGRARQHQKKLGENDLTLQLADIRTKQEQLLKKLSKDEQKARKQASQMRVKSEHVDPVQNRP